MSKKIEDLRAYWQEIASKNGIDPTVAAAMDQALGNEAVAKTFRQAFVPTTEHHSTIDTMKQDYEGRLNQYDQWYNDTAMPAYQANLNGIEKLRQYEASYGPLDPDSVSRQDAKDLGFNSKAELEKYLDDRFRSERVGTLGLMKTIPKMTVDYYNRFKEVLDPNEVEKISVKEGLPPDLAYERYISPRVEAQRQADFEAKLKEAEERGARNALSNHNLPVDSTPRASSPFFDAMRDTKTSAMNEFQQESESKSAFADGWNNYESILARKQGS
jgi:hypothetical protein